MHALNPSLLPVEVPIRRRCEQAVHARGIGAKARHHIVRRDHVAEALRHLGAILDHHALREQPRCGLVIGDHPEVAHEPGPEARVDQVQDGVLNPANVLINRKPILRYFRREWRFVVTRVGVAVEVPRGVHEGVHRVRLAPRRAAAFGTGGVHEFRQAAKW